MRPIVRIGTSALAAVAVAACSSGGGGGGGGGGGATLAMRGGTGSAGAGGNGGWLDVQSLSGGDVRVLASGAVDTSVALAGRTPYLGANPVDVKVSTVLGVSGTGLRLTAGSTVVLDAAGTPVTGIRVRPGVTLTILPNFDTNNLDADDNGATGTREEARFNLSDGLLVEGTVRVDTIDSADAGDGLGLDTADLRIGVGALHVAAGGRIDVSGASHVPGEGANGGAFYASAFAIENAGVITTAGGNGSAGGGDGRLVDVSSHDGRAVSTGILTADGGAGGTGLGGFAGPIAFGSDWAYTVLRGVVSAAGGDGGAAGGAGALVQLFAYDGALVTSATVRSAGGDATAAGRGGDAGGIVFDGYFGGGSEVRVGGTVDARGGRGAGGVAGDGGWGGSVTVMASETTFWNGELRPDSGAVFFGATVDTSGGDGANGGSAGSFSVSSIPGGASTSARAPIHLVGYSRIDGSGGGGSTSGGDAGSPSYLESWSMFGTDANGTSFAGSVSNAAALVLRGGDGATGGRGGGLEMQTDWGIYPPYGYGVTNTGSIDGRGGDGSAAGGQGGQFYLYGKFFLANSANVDASGGTGGTSASGGAGMIELDSSGSLATSGSLLSNAGSTGSGGAADGNGVWIYAAETATVSGALAATGGSSFSGTAGSGGTIDILSQGGPSRVSASLSVARGTGAGAATGGDVWIDGLQVSGP